MYQGKYLVVSVNILLKILTMNSLNVKHQGKSSNQLAFHLSACMHAFKKTFNSNISEAQKVQVDRLNNSESYSFDKNDLQEKVNVLVKLQETMQEKLKTASYSEPIQFLTLVPDEWSRRHVSEYFNIFEQLHMKSKKWVKYQQIVLLKMENLTTLKHFIQ